MTWEDLSRYPPSIRGDSAVDAQLRRQFDESRRAMHRYRRYHLILLAVLMVGALLLVLIRGMTIPGLFLVGAIALVFVVRLWIFRRSEPSG